MSNTKEITTAGGKKIVIKTFITYGDHLKLVDIYGEDTLSKNEKFRKADKTGAELVLVSIDGETEGLYEKYLALPLADATEVADALKEVLNPKAQGNSPITPVQGNSQATS